jgi:prepilin peptidase CpaA
MNTNLLMLMPALLLCALLAAAVWHDVKSRKIPNRLVFSGALAGLALHSLLPVGNGFINAPLGGLGFLASLQGLGIGLAILLPMYMLHAMGAGDVKLMAMVGAFLGPDAIIGTALLSMVAGGILAIIVALWNGKLRTALANSYYLTLHAFVSSLAGAGARMEAPATPSGKLAYAIAIAAGTLMYIFFVKTKVWSLIS